MEKINKTEFSELHKKPWPIGDPAPDFLKFIDEAKAKEFVQLQINFRMKELENQLELYRGALKLL